MPPPSRTIVGASTSETAFVDVFAQGPLDEPVLVTSFAEFQQAFGGLHPTSEASFAIRQYFLNGGQVAWVVRVAVEDAADASAMATALRGDATARTGLHALDRIGPPGFNLLCLPAAALLDDTTMTDLLAEAAQFCAARRAFLIVDIPPSVTSPGSGPDGMLTWMADHDSLRTPNAAVYFPRVRVSNPLERGRLRTIGPSGTLAGLYARTDATRGVWKAPAGIDATLRGVRLTRKVGDRENGLLNPLGINVLRTLPVHGNVSWGARTLDGADQRASEWKYIPVRRTALFIEASLDRGLQWTVFEPNGEPLWAQIRLHVGAFLHDLFRRGTFQGTTPRDAYFVKCDRETTTQAGVDRGIVTVVVGFAPLKPAEFVIITVRQPTRREP